MDAKLVKKKYRITFEVNLPVHWVKQCKTMKAELELINDYRKHVRKFKMEKVEL